METAKTNEPDQVELTLFRCKRLLADLISNPNTNPTFLAYMHRETEHAYHSYRKKRLQLTQ